MDLLQPVLKNLGRRAQLETVDGGDHSLAVKRSAPLEGSEVWLDAVMEFLSKHS